MEMKCPYCGTEASPDAIFCRSCGRRLKVDATASHVDAGQQTASNINYSGSDNNFGDSSNNYQHPNTNQNNSDNAYVFNNKNKSAKLSTSMKLFICIVGLIAAVAYAGFLGSKVETPSSTTNDIENGHIFKSPAAQTVAKVKLTIPNNYSCYAYFKSLSDSSNDFSFYVKNGKTVIMPVPADEYQIYYALGTYWYGLGEKFGDATKYYISDSKLKFTSDDSWEVKITTVSSDDNGSIQKIDSGDFPG